MAMTSITIGKILLIKSISFTLNYFSPLINIAYQPQTIYINQFQGFPPNPYMPAQYSLSPNYPLMGMPDLNTSVTDSSHSFTLGDFDKVIADAENDLKFHTPNLRFGKKKKNSKVTQIPQNF